MKTSISFLKSKCDFEKTIDLITSSKADYIHVDVMDGLFVNNKTIFDKKKLEILKNSKKPKDVHLMTLHLKSYIDVFAYLKPEYITFAFEASANPDDIIEYIKSKDIKVGIAINPFTEINEIKPFLDKIDLVLIMSVIPGYGGQEFILNSKERIRELYKIKQKNSHKFKISIDGGITDKVLRKTDKDKLDIIVAGSYVCEQADYDEQICKLK